MTSSLPPRRSAPPQPPEESQSGVTGADPLLGFVVGGRYQILEKLGRGGMGMVYKVEHLKLNKLLALKLLSGELARVPGVLKRFEREALAASRLSHPSTVQVFDYGTSDGLTYLVMELVQGQDLSRVLKLGGPLAPERVVRLLVQVCGSLSEAHKQGIVHRDIKPGNIMLTRSADGEEMAKVLDFGLAKLRGTGDLNEITARGLVLGTPAYMAPEQIEGKNVDGRTDVYALGALAYRLLTGQHVFVSDGHREMLTRHLVEIPEPPHLRAPERNIPEALSIVILRALEKRPEDRFQCVEDLRIALLRALAPQEPALPHWLDEPSLPIPLIPPENATRDEVASFERKLVRQRRVAQGLLAASLLGAVYAGFGAYRLVTAPPVFDGFEMEPNSTVAQANTLPLGRTVSGHIGKRLDSERPDVDFYRLAIPAEAAPVALRLTGLPNMALCALLYPSNEVEPLARLCTGQTHQELSAPSYQLAPGTYYLAITQNRATQPISGVVENVSDAYHLTVEPSASTDNEEHEPNNTTRTASQLAPGGELRGRLGWIRDEDVVCATSAPQGLLRWTISTQPSLGVDEELSVERIHENEATTIARLRVPGASGAAEQPGPSTWHSPTFRPEEGTLRCIRLRSGSTNASDTRWIVRLQRAPEG